MDPDSNLAEQRRIVERMLNDEENPNYLTDAQRLAELVEALDGWITRGGFLPRAWQR